ncbi:MAG: hypothetical protein QF570_11805 [Myxococcota bacterium]|jgi:Flp pilus assembly protein TadD|nr:hypothetical protein [Myxococcota bacterium]
MFFTHPGFPMMDLRHAAVRRTRRVLGVATLVLVLLAAGGCANYRAAGLYRAGTQALDAGEPEQALAQLEEAARLMPEASEIQNHLGLALVANDRHADALVAFERAAELDCTNTAAAQNLEGARRFAATRTRTPDRSDAPSLRSGTGTK